MKIKQSQEMDAFFNRCIENATDSTINDYIGAQFEKEDERGLQEELSEIGVHEFQKEPWPSLYMSVDEYMNTPYHQAIHLDKIKSDSFEYLEEVIPANELINVDVVIDDENRELNDSLVLRAFDKPYTCVILKQDDEWWMSDTPMEANTINPYANKAHGNVVTFGLGIGYFVFMALLNPNVKKVTVVEKSKNVIQMFKEHLLPQFPRQHDIEIIEGDAFDYFNKDFLDTFDYAFVDFWKSNDDGYDLMEKCLETYLPSFENTDFWIEETCTEFLNTMICMYFFYAYKKQKLFHDDPYYKRIYKKIDTYFSSQNKTYDIYDIKEAMYSKKIKREIMAVQVKD